MLEKNVANFTSAKLLLHELQFQPNISTVGVLNLDMFC